MARERGTFNFSASLEIKKEGALDARQVVQTKAELILPETWTDEDSKVWLYNGLITAVVADTEDNNGIYLLINKDTYNSETGWRKVASLKEGATLEELQEAINTALEESKQYADTKVGNLDFTGSNYITKETDATEALNQLDEEIKATNDNLAILNAATIKGVKVGSNTVNESVANGIVTIANASISSDGALSKEDKSKLDLLTNFGGELGLNSPILITPSIEERIVLGNSELSVYPYSHIVKLTNETLHIVPSYTDHYLSFDLHSNGALTTGQEGNTSRYAVFSSSLSSKDTWDLNDYLDDKFNTGDGTKFLADDFTYKELPASNEQEIYTIVPSETANEANASVYTLLKNNSNIVVVYKDNDLFFPVSWSYTATNTFMGSAITYKYTSSTVGAENYDWVSYDINIHSDGVCYCTQRSLQNTFGALGIFSFIYPSDNVTATEWNASLYSIVNPTVGYAVVIEGVDPHSVYNKHIGKLTKTSDNITIVCTEGNTQITYVCTSDGNITKQETDITIDWSNIGSKPSTFTPSTHTHTVSQITDLQDKLDEYYPKTGIGYLSFDTNGRPVMANNQGYSFKRTDGSLLEALFVSSNNELVIGGTSSDYVTDIILHCTNLVNKSRATYLHTGNIGSITFTGAVSATYNGTNDITVNIPTAGGGAADSVDWSNVTNKPNFATVATSGDYNDLTNKPTIPSLSGYATQTWVTQQIDTIDIPNVPSWALSSNKPSYSYSEISGTIPAADLPMASSDTLGGIRVGAGLSISSNGTLSATGGGTADSVDWENVVGKPSWMGSTKPSYSYSEISGTIPIADIPTGTTGSTVALGNHTHSNYLTSSSLTGYATQTWVNSQIEAITPASIGAAASSHTHTIGQITNMGTLTFTGAATGSYDGSGDLTINIPEGSSVDTSNFVTLDGTQTITGTKTFTQYTVFNAGAGTSSDKRLKRSIKPIENPFEILEGLTGYRYNLISNNAKSIGLIAQDVEKVLPEAVRTDDEGYKSVDTYPIVAVLVETIKELKKEIEELKSKL